MQKIPFTATEDAAVEQHHLYFEFAATVIEQLKEDAVVSMSIPMNMHGKDFISACTIGYTNHFDFEFVLMAEVDASAAEHILKTILQRFKNDVDLQKSLESGKSFVFNVKDTVRKGLVQLQQITITPESAKELFPIINLVSARYPDYRSTGKFVAVYFVSDRKNPVIAPGQLVLQ